MNVLVTYTDGSTQESYGVETVRIEDGYLVLDRRRFLLTRVLAFTTGKFGSPPSARVQP